MTPSLDELPALTPTVQYPRLRATSKAIMNMFCGLLRWQITCSAFSLVIYALNVSFSRITAEPFTVTALSMGFDEHRLVPIQAVQ
jgi:hypothetical protein